MQIKKYKYTNIIQRKDDTSKYDNCHISKLHVLGLGIKSTT